MRRLARFQKNRHLHLTLVANFRRWLCHPAGMAARSSEARESGESGLVKRSEEIAELRYYKRYLRSYECSSRSGSSVVRSGNLISEASIMQGNSRRTILPVLAVFACLSILLDQTESIAAPPSWTTVRGRLVGSGMYGPNTPIGGMRLTLHSNRFGRSFLVVSRPDGRFRFQNMPSGRYLLEVWFPRRPSPRTFEVRARRQPISDIGTLRLW